MDIRRRLLQMGVVHRRKIATVFAFRNNEDNRTCPICLTDFIPNEQVALLHCIHLFHVRCFMRFLRTQLTRRRTQCPICRHEL